MHLKLVKQGRELEITRMRMPLNALMNTIGMNYKQRLQYPGFMMASEDGAILHACRRWLTDNYALRRSDRGVLSDVDIQSFHRRVSTIAAESNLVIDPSSEKALLDAKASSPDGNTPAIRVRMDSIGVVLPNHRQLNQAPRYMDA